MGGTQFIVLKLRIEVSLTLLVRKIMALLLWIGQGLCLEMRLNLMLELWLREMQGLL